ncbi:MAG TPA: porin family protein [Puia sp.]|uniref:porin family protein n=1 Tax=Puia sp. TaxID=2045100 RepID=UPI002C4D73CD|nr:porin family protein [Puia sp.]HVU98142.1 porin family protein [Puia sp.]
MKRTILTLSAALLLTASTAFGQQQQTSSEPNLKAKFGIKGGFDLTTLYSSDVSTNHMKAGFDAGVFAKLPVTRGFSIQPELLYSLKGAKSTYSNFVQGNGEYRFNLGYIQVPVLAVVNLAPNFNLHLGGYAAYLVNSNIKNVSNNGDLVSATELNTGDFNRWDFGLAGGAAFDIGNVTLGARYNYGLSEIGKSGSASGDLTKGMKNAGFSFYAGFGF